MRFFHLSDLHIGLKLINRDLREDQEYIFDQITDYVKKETPQALVIAGDIYDKAVPSAEAVEVFDYLIAELTEAAPDMTIMIISGIYRKGYFTGCIWKCEFLSAPICEAFYGEGNHRDR